MRIEDYAVIGDTHTVALVGRNGSIDWLCVPRFDSEACFAKLLGDESNGYWLIAPQSALLRSTRRYRPGTLVLETEMETEDGTVRLVDCMPLRENHPEVVRLVEGVSGRVRMRMELSLRFDYGSIRPWVRRIDGMLSAVAGPSAVRFWSPVPTRGEDFITVAEFTVTEGMQLPFMLAWHPSHEAGPRPIDGRFIVEDTQRWWEDWSSTCRYDGEHKELVQRSLCTLKALTYDPTGGIVAAGTTSLPECIGGVRNWDYRYCWLRDATFTLYSLLIAGYRSEAVAWRDWLLRAVAGDPADLQIMYGPAGERRLNEWEISWLPGYEGSKPVRLGNAAAEQFQLDVYGEVMDALYQARMSGIEAESEAWNLQVAVAEFLEDAWRLPDEGIWEVRGPRRHFVHSKIMAWVAFDRAVKSIDRFGVKGPRQRWADIRDEIHAEVCAKGYRQDRAGRPAFTQYYGSEALDAAILMAPLVGFIPADDPRMLSTVAAIEEELMQEGFVRRYETSNSGEVDGLVGEEGVFLPCSFWLADNYCLAGRREEAVELFERLVALCNDVGLFSEEYDVARSRQVGNFPQAFTHVSLVNSAFNLFGHTSPAHHRRRGATPSQGDAGPDAASGRSSRRSPSESWL